MMDEAEKLLAPLMLCGVAPFEPGAPAIPAGRRAGAPPAGRAAVARAALLAARLLPPQSRQQRYPGQLLNQRFGRRDCPPIDGPALMIPAAMASA